jgi:hypothetical protein
MLFKKQNILKSYPFFFFFGSRIMLEKLKGQEKRKEKEKGLLDQLE